VETAKLLQEKEKNSEILKDSLLSDFLPYEERLKKIYRSVVKFEYWLKIKYKPPPPSTVVPDTRISSHKPNDSAPLTERLDKVIQILSSSTSTCFPEISSPRHSRSATLSPHSRVPALNSHQIFSVFSKHTG
jgi:hypothetical protein